MNEDTKPAVARKIRITIEASREERFALKKCAFELGLHTDGEVGGREATGVSGLIRTIARGLLEGRITPGDVLALLQKAGLPAYVNKTEPRVNP